MRRKTMWMELLFGVMLATAACDEGQDETETISLRPGSQGDPDVCAGCQLAGNVLDLWIDRAYEGQTVVGITLYLDDGEAVDVLELGARQLSSSQRTRIVLDRDDIPSELVEVRIAIALAGRGTPRIEQVRVVD